MSKPILAVALALTCAFAVGCGSADLQPIQEQAGGAAQGARGRGAPATNATSSSTTQEQLDEARRQDEQVKVDDAEYAAFEKKAQETYANAPPPSTDGMPIAKRAVVVVNDSSTGSPDPAKFRYIDRGMKLLFDLGLKNAYGNVVYLGEGDATWVAFLDNVGRLAKDPNVSVVDAMINLHGAPGAIAFNDQFVETQQIADDLIKAVPDDVFYKLRVVYNQACFGASHTAGFIGGGFLSATGTRGTHNSGVVDWPTFVSTWGTGGTIQDSVTRGTAATLVSTIEQWFGGSDVDNTWVLDGAADVSVGTELTPSQK
jgi:hypothetical protein